MYVTIQETEMIRWKLILNKTPTVSLTVKPYPLDSELPSLRTFKEKLRMYCCLLTRLHTQDRREKSLPSLERHSLQANHLIKKLLFIEKIRSGVYK